MAGCLHQLFEDRAARGPHAVAVVAPHEALTYGELEIRANRLAHLLRARGVGPEMAVGLCVGGTVERVVALLAILKAGGAYVPLDPADPPERMAFLLADSGAPLAVVEPRFAGLLPATVPVLRLDGAADRAVDHVTVSPALPERRVESGNLAYVIYTSGSTGKPKGVLTTHGGAVNLVREAVRLFGADPAARVFQGASLGFDASVLEIFLALAAGGQLVLGRDRTPLAGPELARRLAREQVTALATPPPLLTTLEPEELSSLTTLVLGGDSCPPATAARWAVGRRLWNAYAPTEATVFATAWQAPAEERELPIPLPIGRPIARLSAELVDDDLRSTPPGELGEIALSGAGLARGYLGRPDLTAERFVPHPAAGSGTVPAGDRLYRTGDLGRLLATGDLEFAGRVDRQVKIRGVRVEPGEVEAALAALPAVAEAVVVPRADGAGDRRLVAYLVGRAGCRPTARELREELGRRLPAALIPATFVVLGALPRTANGKIDLAALPVPEPAPEGTDGDLVLPRGETEEALAALFRQLLGLSRVGVRDSFFELGGHSLLAAQLAARARRDLGVELPLELLFAHPTIEGLARALDGGEPAAPPLPPLIPGPRPELLPLSFPQERVWFLDRLSPGNVAYNFQLQIRLRGPLDPGALARALAEVVRRHEILRTRFPEVHGGPIQVIEPPWEVTLPRIDLSGLAPEARERAASAAIATAIRLPFALDRLPLIRWSLLRLAPDEHRFLQIEHHLVHDGWSLSVLTREITELYAAYAAGRPADLPEPSVQYADFALWQRGFLAGEVLEGQLAWWRQQLAGYPPALELPADHPRPHVPSFRGNALLQPVPAGLARTLREHSRRSGATLFMTLFAGFAALLARLSGQEDLCVGSGVANRRLAETERMLGMVVNTLVLRADLSANPDFNTLMGRVRTMVLGAQAHQDLPFEKLVEALRPERRLAVNPLFQVLFSFHDSPMPELSFGGATGRLSACPNGSAKADLNVVAVPEAEQRVGRGRAAPHGGEDLEILWEYSSDLFERPTAIRMLERYIVLLAAATADPRCPLADLPLLAAAERHQLLVEWNDRAIALAADADSVPGRFAAVRAAAPERTAVVFAGFHLSYGELATRANRLAHELKARGVGTDVPVVLYLHRSPWMVVATLAVLGAGGAYVPLDPSHPAERQRLLVKDAADEARRRGRAELLVLTVARRAAEIEAIGKSVEGARVLCLDDGEAARAISRRPASPPPAVLGGDALCYVIYTSGSTGRPKGVAVSHRAVLRLAFGDFVTLGPGVRVGHVSNTAFDAATFELWGALLHGGTVAGLSGDEAVTPRALAAAFAAGRIDVLFLTATLWNEVAREDPRAFSPLEGVLFGGEAADPTRVREVLAAGPPRRLLNGYGPTECTTFAAVHSVAALAAEAARVPIGRPIGNTRAVVLDRAGTPQPIGVAGELCLGGDGLARGYLGRPERTAERFIPDPFPARPGARLYRTGDLVKAGVDGSLDLLGRLDGQVKLRGFRIELGEVEGALCRHPDVAAAAAALHRVGAEARLVGYVVPRRGGGTAALLAGLRAFLKPLVPEPMIPSLVVAVEALPRTPNGKLDRAALPAPEVAERADGARFVAPRTPIEEVVAGFWRELLPVGGAAISVEDDFFDLGGHSLLVTRLLSRIRTALEVELSVQTLFECATVAALARAVTAARQEEIVLPPLVAAGRGGRAPLSFSQQRLWFLSRLAPDSAVYNVSPAFRLRGAVQPPALAAALGEILRRQDVLRTRFVEVDGEPWQEVLPATPFRLPLVDLAGLPEERGGRRSAELARLRRNEATRPFDLAEGPLLRATLVRLAAEEQVLLMNLHHIVSDGWSIGVLLGELEALYGAAVEGSPSPLPELTLRYADFAVWQRAWPPEVLARQLAYWQDRLAGTATLAVPTDRPRPPLQTFRGGKVELAVPPALTTALRQLARGGRATLFMTVLAAWQALFHRLTGQVDVAIGSPVANRTRREVEGLVGFFVNLLALRTDCGGDPSFAGLLERVRRGALAAYDHADLPFERLVDELSPHRDLSRQPLVQVMFQLEGAVPALALPGLETEALKLEGSFAKFDLTLSLLDRGDALTGTIEHSADLFDKTTAARLAGQLVNLLGEVAAHPEAPLSSLGFLAPAERHALLAEWNDTAAAFPEATLVQDLFAAQATHSPAALAAVSDGRKLLYGELAARANRLAHLLRAQGLPRGGGVGVWMERSLDLLVAVLGILEAGGHYLPLDTGWPAERVETILAATGACAVLVGATTLPAVEEMRWRLPALKDVVCLACATPEPAVEAVDRDGVRTLWDFVAERAVDRVSAAGFVSSLTGLPFAAAEVDEYRDRVLSLAAPWLHAGSRVLEIGCGSGLLLWEIAPRVARTVGIDPSPRTQERNRERRQALGLDGRVDLFTGFAHELDDLLAGDERFDLVLLASAVQFFPGPRYLEQVVKAALARLAPGGTLLLADVLDARRRGDLRRAVEAARRGRSAAPALGAPGSGSELYLDEDLFRDLGALPGAGEVSIAHRTTGFDNELRFRYDVLIGRADGTPDPATEGLADGRRRQRLWTAWHVDRQPAWRLPAVASAEDLAYVIYTSGSTGEPKGIAVQHRPVANLIAWINRALDVGAGDRVLFLTSLSFDLSVYDIFGVLAAGGTVHVATDEEIADPDRLVGLLAEGGITIWDSAPAALMRLAPLFPEAAETRSRLRQVLLSGDWIPVTLPERVRRAYPAARVTALGGATEATVWSNWFAVEEVPPHWASIPYGRPIANATYHVLDAALAPCPIGIPGDLYIGGLCLSSFYAGRPEQTAASFLPDPFGGRPGARLYRTGDRVRVGPDGNREFLGRLDHQVKVRGYRIELGEIELVLARSAGVREAVVLAYPAGPEASHDLRLVAYVVPASEPALSPPSARALRDELRRVLPEYMVPAAFVFLPALPVTPNGKLDRQALPAPIWEAGAAGGARRGGPAPRTPLEERLAGLWIEVLGLGDVALGVDDNFFELGGHSLLATQLVARIRQTLGVEAPLRTLFQHPSLGDLAAALAPILALPAGDGATAVAPAIVPVPRQGRMELSYSQLRLWFLTQLEPRSTAYNVPLSLRLSGRLGYSALARSLDGIVRRHETLRTSFAVIDGQPSPQVAPTAVPSLAPALLDLGGLSSAARHDESRRLVQAQGDHVFDLAHGPLYRFALVRLQADEHLLLFNVHHIVFDGWSLGVFLRELAALYEGFLAGRPTPLPELAIQYLDYAAWQRCWLAGEEGRRQIDYWRARLSGATRTLDLPTDHPRPAVQTYRGGALSLVLPGPLAGRLRWLGLTHGATPFMVLLAAFQSVLHRYTRQDDLNVGTFVANRRWQSIEPLIGFFLNTLVLRTDLAGGPSFGALLDRVRETTLGAYEHQDVPFEMLLEELEGQRDLSRPPLFQVLFELQNFAAPAARAAELEISSVSLYELRRTNFDLALWLGESGPEITGKLQFNRDLFAPTTVARLAGHLVNLLEGAVAAPDRPLAEIPLLTPAEHQQVAGDWIDGGWREGEAPHLVQGLVAAQAARTPDAAALVQGDVAVSYGELARRVTRLARRLYGMGVGPESVVGLGVPRRPEMVVGLLAILAAGAAYLPLDQDLPAERIAFLLADSGSAALLVTEPRPASLASFAGPVVRLDEPWVERTEDAVALPETAGDNLAYIIYTSGSTGRPKGVQVVQDSLARFTLAALATYGIGRGDRVLQFASLSFDTSAEEIFPALVGGATLVLRTAAMTSSTAQFFAACRDQQITVLDLPTAYWHTLAADLPGDPGALPAAVRTVIMGGERPLPERVLGWLAAVGPHPRLWNTYGPTEATVMAALGTLGRPGDPAVTATVVPLGRPWGGARIWLLDPDLYPVPPGVVGEMHIAGRSLARGYVGRPDLTAAAFLPCAGGEPGERRYRSGDLARHRADGTLEFAGRVDHQVKIRGFRIEPEEIAVALSSHPAVREAVVVASEVAAGERRLIAYYVAGGEPGPPASELREFLKARLPGYMVPADFVALPAMPLSVNGKLDVGALPPPEGQGGDGYAPPETAVEELLVQIWEEVLHRERIGIDDNLFDLGGHSLLLPQLVARIEQVLELTLPLRVLFEAPTVAQLAVVVEQAVLSQIEGLSDAEAASLLAGSPEPVPTESENV